MTEDPSQKRVTPRVDVTLKVALQYPDRETFVERFSINVSKTGLFIRARDPAPVGSRVRFEYRLKDDSRILRGTGIVRWARAAAQAKEPDAPPGMGIEFVDLDPQSEELVSLIVAQRGEGERAPRKATPKLRPDASATSSAPAQPIPELDAEEEELLSGLELGGADSKVRDDVPAPIEAPPPQAQQLSAEMDPLAALEELSDDPLVGLATQESLAALGGSAAAAHDAPAPSAPPRGDADDPLADLDALLDEPVPPRAPTKPVAPTTNVVDPDAPHVVVDLAGPCILATLLMPNEGAPPDRFDERKLELTATIRDGKLMLGQSGVATRALYAWADTKLTLRNRLAAESYGFALSRDANGRPVLNVEGANLALVDLAVSAAKYTLDAYGDQLAATPVFRIIVPATIASTVRAELQSLATRANPAVQIVDDVVAIANVARQDQSVVVSMSDFETRIARISGQSASQLQSTDGLAELDALVTQATARALLKEHGIDADDDPSLRDSLAKQVRLARRDGDSSSWHVSIAGATVTMDADAVTRALDPALRRIAIAVDAIRGGSVVVLASDEPLWPGIAERLEALLGPLEALDASPWLRVNS